MNQSNPANAESKFPYFATFVVILAVIALIGLGLWQVDRAQQKQYRLEQIAQRQAETPISLETLLEWPGNKEDLPFRTIGKVYGHNYFLLDNRIEQGRVGYHVLLPVETEQGILITNFGFIAAGQDRQSLPTVEIPTGMMNFSGVSAIPKLNPMVKETASGQLNGPKVVQQIDLAFLGQLLNQPVLDIVMQLDPSADSTFIRNWKPVVMAPEKHYAYALQWFGLAIACLIIYVVAFIRRKPKGE